MDTGSLLWGFQNELIPRAVDVTTCTHGKTVTPYVKKKYVHSSSATLFSCLFCLEAGVYSLIFTDCVPVKNGDVRFPRSITKGWFRLCPFKRNNFWSCPTSVSVFHKLPEPCTYWNSGHTTRMQCAHTCLYVRVAGMFYVQNTQYCPDVCLSKFIQVYSFLSLSLCICPFVHLSICPSFHLSICLCVYMSIYRSTYVFFCLYACMYNMYVHACVYWCMCVFMYVHISQ